MRRMHPQTSCVLYDGQKCNGKDGLKELSNRDNLVDVKRILEFDIESVSVRHGCQLTLYTGKFSTTNYIDKLHILDSK
jgi:hypothetical protein